MVFVTNMLVKLNVAGGLCCGKGHCPIQPVTPVITSQDLVMIVTLFTAHPLHQSDLAMCMCTLALLLKNDGLFRASQELQTYRVTVQVFPLSDIAHAQNSMTAEYMARNIHNLRK
jgi:hypothetical protein